MKYLVLGEVSKKQEYIFKSNKLKENIGASLIIKYVTEILPKEIMSNIPGKAIFGGGGKSLYIFEDENSSMSFVEKISEGILRKFPGLDMYFVTCSIDFDKEDIIDKISSLYKKLNDKKNKRENSSAQISFGIEKICRSTGMCATSYSNEDGQPISAEIEAKLKFANKNDVNFDNITGGKKYYYEFDEYKSDDKSYISVVHIDGNDMGNKFNMLKTLFSRRDNIKEHNEKYIGALSKLSKDISKIYEDSFLFMVNEVSKGDKLNIRPLIFAGDDISFVCEPNIAIKACKIFLDKLNSYELKIGNVNYKLNACAGIAFVKSHYPFSRAYTLAEQLCKNCKTAIINEYNKKDMSMIDWHIVQGEISGTLEYIREKEYVVSNNKLNMRPIIVNDCDIDWKNYFNFKCIFNSISNETVPRNKIKGLRNIYKSNEYSVKNYYDVNKLEDTLENMKNKSLMNIKNGVKVDNPFYKNTAIFFDAIEIMDFMEALDM